MGGLSRRRWLRCAAALGLVGASFLPVLFAPPSEEVARRPTEALAPVEVRETLADPIDNATVATTEVATATLHGADEVELCGGARLKIDANGLPDIAEFSRLAREPKTRERILDRMRSSSSELARTAALLLASLGDDENRLAMLGFTPPCEGADCPATESAMEAARRSLDAITRVAMSTSDPKVYALALALCAGKTGTVAGACGMLSAAQWSRLDPGNAAPWHPLLAAAKVRGDTAAQNEALFRIANAPRNDVNMFSAAGAVLDAALDDDASVLAAWGLVTDAVSVGAVFAIPAYQELTAMCKGDALRDANRLQTCAAVAETLAERSDTMIGRNIGVAIGKQVGWPVERGERMRGEYESYITSLGTDRSDLMGLGCATMRRDLALWRRHAALGETGALREWVAKSGIKPEAFIREQRARERQRDVAAATYQREQAASAAAASAAAAQR